MSSLRERNRRSAMRETQRIALDLFMESGFDRVTVEEIATRLGMAPSTVYRHFGTKEKLVLWDEHDQAIDEALAKRLGSEPPFVALRDGLIESLGHRYDADLQFQVARIGYIYATPQLHAAAIEAEFRHRAALSAALTGVLPRAKRPAAPILAACALVAVDVALDRWQQVEGKRPLTRLLREAFDSLAHLESIG